MRSMRIILLSVAMGSLLSACGGGGSKLPEGVQKKSLKDIGAICVDYDKSMIDNGFKTSDARKALLKQIDKTCCPQVSKAAKQLDGAGQALVWYAFAQLMDNVYSPNEVNSYSAAFNSLRNDMTPAAFDAAYDVFMIRSSCGVDLERKAGMNP